MALDASPQELLTFGSAIPLVALGALLLFLRPRRPENGFFAAFAIGWGLQVASANLSRITDSADLHDVLFRTSIALTLPTAFFLAYFACLHPRRNAVARHPFGPTLLLVAVLPGLAALALQPELVVQDTVGVDGEQVSVYGPWFVPLVVVPFFGSFYYALAVQFRAARRETLGPAAQRARMVVLALAPFVSYLTTHQVLHWAFPTAHQGAQAETVRNANALLFGAGFVLVVTFATLVALRPARRGDVDRPLLLAFVAPALVGAAERGLSLAGWSIETLAAWRIVAVALVVYAVARHQLFDLHVRLNRGLTRALAPSVGLLGLAFVASLILGRAGAWPIAATSIAGIAATALVAQHQRTIGGWLLPPAGQQSEYLYQRKLEVYRDALEAALATDPATRADAPGLRRLRAELGLDASAHEVLEFVARTAIGRRAAVPGAPARAEPGALLCGRYRVERLLGEGAHGRAYLAHDERASRPVVVKVVAGPLLDGRAAKLLLREARILAQLDHPHVVRILDDAEGTHETLLVMEYCEGGSLQGLLERRGRLPTREAAELFDGILAGLEAAHARGIVHRDLKPGNVLLTATGPRLADFGVAREARADATIGAAHAGALGTLHYMSPEQVRGIPVDSRSDLYSAAIIYLQLLTGRFYLRLSGLDDFQVRQRILTQAPRLDVEPVGTRVFLERAFEKDPARRYQSASEMRRALRTTLQSPRADGAPSTLEAGAAAAAQP